MNVRQIQASTRLSNLSLVRHDSRLISAGRLRMLRFLIDAFRCHSSYPAAGS